MNKWQKFWGHLRTIQKHRKAVRKLCFKCGLYWQGLTHDLSKYSPTEFWLGVKYYTGTASPHVSERKDKGYSKAWLHHHNRNKHHAEYWVDIVEGRSQHIRMPYKYFAEMLCDRIAASMVYLKDKYTDNAPLDYFLSHQAENRFHPEVKEELELALEWLAQYGQEDLFKKIKLILDSDEGWDIQ